MILDIDMSQLEWRTAAFLSQDQTMIKEICEGIDQHAAACVDLMELPLTKENRTDAKIFNFRMIYFGQPYAFFMDSRMPNFSLKKWEGIVERFLDKYNGLAAWWSVIFKEVNKTGKLINPTGRILEFKKVTKANGTQEYHKPHIANYPVQSLGAEIVQLWMILCDKKLREISTEIKFINQVHDSLILSVPEKYIDITAKTCLEICNNLPYHIEKFFGFNFNVPLTGEAAYGPSWGELTSWENK